MIAYRLTPDVGFIDVSSPVGLGSFIGIYVIRAERTALVDVGPLTSVEYLFAGLKELGIAPIDVDYIFTTHVHLDHNGGLGAVIKQMPKAVVIAHEKGKPHFVSPVKLWESSQQTLGDLTLRYGRPLPVPENRLVNARDGMKIDLGGTEVEVLFTPGHALHHLSFLDTRTKRLFAGDAAGCYVRNTDLIRPASPSPFNLELTLASVDKLIHIAPESICFTHFGCLPNAVDRLCDYKQRLLLWGTIIAKYLADGADCRIIYDEIKGKDKALGQIEHLPPEDYAREYGSVKTGIIGYINYFKKYGTGCLNTRSKGQNR